MDFYKKYELLELLRGDRVRVFSGREIVTGRAVQVHLFTSGKTPETTALLERACQAPPGYRGVLLDIGEHEGTPYVVTVLPAGFETLEAWLDRVVPAVRREAPLQSKIWKIPAIPAPAKPPVSAPPAPGARPPAAARPLAPSDDAFAQLFGSLEPGQAAAPAPAQPAEGPTRMLQAAPPPPPKPAAMAPPPPPPRAAAPQPDPFALLFESPPAAPVPQAPPAGGDFRHLIITPDRPTPGAPPAPPAPVAPPPPSAGAGEFTRMFQAPAAAAQPGAPVPPAPPRPQQAGEFTRMFQAPSGAAPAPAPAPAPPPAESGEFTRFFKSPLEPKPLKETGPGTGSSGDPFAGRPLPPSSSKPLDAPGEFTRMFGKDDIPGRKTPAAPPGPPMSPPPSMGSVTQAFAAPAQPQPGPLPGVPPPDMQASGPSEYTRLFKAPAAVPEPAPVAPQAAAAPAPPKASKLPLILVIAGLVAVIVILVLFLVLRK